jgi:hypothetical protein
MATVIGVGMQMTANAAGMTKGLSDADKALQLLQKIVDQNQQSMRKFSGESDATAKSLDKLTSGVSTLSRIEIGRVLVGGFQVLASAFTTGAQNVLTLAKNASDSLDSINDLSARTGIGVEALQGYGLAAKMAGVDTEQFGVAVQKLAVNIGKATPGDALDKSLKAINLSVVELRGLAPEQQFTAIGNAISVLPTAADRAAAAVAIFGKQGAALAPLFREGAASIEDLKAKAERLGIIVSETQINNVADMNDAFDLVRATVQGIIGQVVGNLAPAVTEVTNQFLKFVEEWSGAQGQGGTGIANAITDVLLHGAEIFAGVFDKFMADFGGLTEMLAGTGDVFAFVTNMLTALSETFRYVFNIFEVVGNNLMLGLGKILEGLGSWVNSDLESVGKELALQSQILLDKNKAEMEAAKQNAIDATAAAFGGAPETAKKAGDTAGVTFVQSLQERIKRERSPVFKLETNLDDTEKRLQAFLAEAGDGASKFLQQSAGTLDYFKKTTEQGNLLSTQVKIMSGFAANVNAELDKEIAKRRQAADAARFQAEEENKRIEELLKQKDKERQVDSDLSAVIRAQAEVKKQLAAARSASSQVEATAAAARLAQLDQLRAKLEGDQAAIDQGFANGFTAAFTKTAEGLSGLITKAGEFGNAGAEAAKKLQDGVAKAQDQARDGILTNDSYEREIAAQRKLFEERLAYLEEVKKREQQNRADAFQGQIDANARVQAFLQQQAGEGARAEIAAALEVEARKKEAALNIRAIENQIALEQQAVNAAREQGDMKSAKAGIARIEQLKQAKKIEDDIANGKNTQIAKQNNSAQSVSLASQQFAQAAANQAQAISQAAKNSSDAANYAIEKTAESAAKQADFLRQLNTLGSRTVQTADVRTQQGAAIVTDLAAQSQDPALIEARLQTKALKAIRDAIVEGTTNAPVPVRI